MAKQKIKQKKNDVVFCLIILVPFIIQFLVFWLFANMNSIKLAFTEYNHVTDTHTWLPFHRLLENFERFFKEVLGDVGIGYVLNGAYFHILSAFVCLPISYMIAFVLYKKVMLSDFFKVVLYVPSILSSMITILLFKHFIESGINGLLYNLFEVNMPFLFKDPLYNRMILSVYIIFYSLPGNLLVNLGTMSRTPPELIEYGNLEGITLWKEFYTITLPLMFPVIQVQCLGLFVGFFTTQGPLFTFYGNAAPENLRTFGYYMFCSIATPDSAAAAKYMYGYTSAANLTIGLLSVPIVQLTKKLFDLFDTGAEF